jgi:hypothetical protein
VLSNDKPFYRAFSLGPNERSDFANPVGELLAITNRRLCEPDLTSLCYQECADKCCTEGSNPSLSATQSELQRNQAVLLQESLKIAAIPQVLSSSRTGESVPSNLAGKVSGVFLWRAYTQSAFSDSIKRT